MTNPYWQKHRKIAAFVGEYVKSLIRNAEVLSFKHYKCAKKWTFLKNFNNSANESFTDQ